MLSEAKRSRNISVLLGIVGTLRFLGIMGTACGLYGVCGLRELHGLRGYTKNPHLTYITHLT